jgi:hypothetical protein
LRISIVIILCFSASTALAQRHNDWELPNFSDRVDLVVENPTGRSMNALAIVNIADVRKIAPQFPGTLAIACESKEPTLFLESQTDSLDGDGEPKEFAVSLKLGPHEKKSLSIYYSTTLHENLPSVKRVHATHSYGYNHATAALESERIGYRIYGGFFFDVQAHARGQSGLFNSLIGYSSISIPPAEGQDVIHLGDTLGLGGLFLRADGDTFRPPMNTPDYTHRAPKPGEPVYRVISDGPLRAVVEARLPHWTIGKDEVSLRALYEMRAGEETVRCQWWITPVRLSRSYEVGVGIRNLSEINVAEAKDLLITSGTQEAKAGPIAIGLSYSAAEAQRGGILRTPDGGNQIITFTRKLEPQQPLSGEYAFAAAWSGSGWSDVSEHLREILENERAQPKIEIVRHEMNPEPQRLEGEPK